MDFYIVLGITRDASLPDIKRAYKRLARRFHPDINPGDHTAAGRFRDIAEAYAILSDPARRRQYDTVGYQTPTEGASVGFEGFDFSAGAQANQESTFGDLFADVFQREAAASSADRGPDLHATIALTFDESFRGSRARVTVTRQDVCRECAGRGSRQAAPTRCPRCQGTGALRSARGHMVFSRPCPRCGGGGVLREVGCAACNATGIQVRAETVTVSLPPGIRDGSHVRVEGKGHVGRAGGVPGDLYVTVKVAVHPLFRRDGDDLHLEVPIAVHEAALGSRIEVPSPDGPARLRVPPGTQSGQRFRMRERGMPALGDGRRGDLIIDVRLMLPKVLDERSKALLRELGLINGESVREAFDRRWRCEPASEGRADGTGD
jgi:molecular chaperone DnaJ